jgi:hypothetical protein
LTLPGELVLRIEAGYGFVARSVQARTRKVGERPLLISGTPSDISNPPATEPKIGGDALAQIGDVRGR